MSWWLHLVPASELAHDDVLAWATSVPWSRRLPDEPPRRPLAPVVAVVDALRASGCHGASWFEIAGREGDTGLPACPDPATCSAAGGLDLGEVLLAIAGRTELTGQSPPLPPDAGVTTVGFRKPLGAAALRAVCALTEVTGPLLVFDDHLDRIFVPWPGEQPDQLADEWPW